MFFIEVAEAAASSAAAPLQLQLFCVTSSN